MTAPYFADATVTLHHGDCLEVLRRLSDASVDAVVTDPPYGLEFMGKEWDGADGFRRSLNPSDAGRESVFGRTSTTSPEYRTASKAQASRRQVGGISQATAPSFLGGLNPKCLICDHWQRGSNPCRCEAPEWTQERLVRLHSFQEWCEVWSRECLRVLRPGGHLLAFGGTRTFHRLASAVEDSGFEVRDSIAWLYGSGFPKSRNLTDENGERTGWGTALKPAFEPIVVARKPLSAPAVNVLAMVESALRDRGITGEIRWTSGPASDAARLDLPTSSSSTAALPTEATSAAPVAASGTVSDETLGENGSALSTPHGGLLTPSSSPLLAGAPTESSARPSSTPTAGSAPAAPSGKPSSSPSTTSTVAAPLTESRSTARSTPSSDARASLPATESFAGIATGLTGSRATVRIDRLPSGEFVWPDGLPERIAGGSTVAANVLAHGTGALNIDASRIEGEDAPEGRLRHGGGSAHSDSMSGPLNPDIRPASPAGRWPANVILDEDQADALDQQSGELTSGANPTRYGEFAGQDEANPQRGVDVGGAARFFYTAKADAGERPRIGGVAHPTVKPLALMRWLVRLVTPPGGTVLEPFAGSGTTVEACILEGFGCIAIEREAGYLPLIVQRINRRRDPVAAVKGSGDDGGLFDLLGEVSA